MALATAGRAAADVDGRPPRACVGRVLDAPGAPSARARAVRADAGGVAAAAPPAVRGDDCSSPDRLRYRLCGAGQRQARAAHLPSWLDGRSGPLCKSAAL